MEKADSLRKKVKNMFLARELYDITTFEGMKEIYSETVCKLWRELAEAMPKTQSKEFSDDDLTVFKLFKNTKPSDIEGILGNINKIKECRVDINRLL